MSLRRVVGKTIIVDEPTASDTLHELFHRHVVPVVRKRLQLPGTKLTESRMPVEKTTGKPLRARLAADPDAVDADRGHLGDSSCIARFDQ